MKLFKMMVVGGALLAWNGHIAASDSKSILTHEAAHFAYVAGDELTHAAAVQLVLDDVSDFLAQAKKAGWSDTKIESTLKSVIKSLQKNTHSTGHHNHNNNAALNELQQQQVINLREEIAYFHTMRIAGYSVATIAVILSLVFVGGVLNG